MKDLVFENLKSELCEKIYKIEADSIDEPWSLNGILGLVNDRKAIARVGLLNGEVVCYYSLYNICGEGYVNNLAVSVEYRGKGCGSMLMNDMLSVAKDMNITALTLEVNENNKFAIALYEKFGFSVEGKRVKFYNGKDDALIMWNRNPSII